MAAMAGYSSSRKIGHCNSRINKKKTLLFKIKSLFDIMQS